MKLVPLSLPLLVLLVATSCVGLGCAADVPLGSLNQVDAVGAGGALGSGGAGSGGSHVDAALGTGGSSGGPPDAPMGTGGLAGQTGGQVGTGGVVASGGLPGTGGGTGIRCGTIAGLGCPTGTFCDLMACGTSSDAAGTCQPTGGGCTTEWVPVCGCDHQTYGNDCTRRAAGVSKASDGACGGGTGGKPGTGGNAVDGGVPGSGGKTGSGGATATGGMVTSIDGGTTNSACPYECRTDSSGVTGWYSGSTLVCAANCTACVASCSVVGTKSEGCYASCSPGSTAPAGCNGVSSADLIAYKACGGSYPTAYLQWEAPGGVAGTGPAVVVSAAGWADTWDNVQGFSPETPPSSATGTYALTRIQTDDLFSRLASVNVSALPHPMSISFHEAYPRLYFRLCQDCAATTLQYNSSQQLAPEMEAVWAWFDTLLGANATSNPRVWCNWSS